MREPSEQERIMALIVERPRQFIEIHGALGGDAAIHFRVVDRELQKMRRAGLIAYDKGKRVWRAAAPAQRQEG